MNPWPDLRPILKGIAWAIVGGVATRAYMPERMTKDMDILVHQRDGENVIKRLEGAGYHIGSRLAVAGDLMVAPDGTELDVLFGTYPWIEEALTKTGLDPAGYPVVKLPYLTLMKMEAQRAQDWTDVSRMLGWASDADLDEVRKAVAKYAPEDSDDLEVFNLHWQKGTGNSTRQIINTRRLRPGTCPTTGKSLKAPCYALE